jgi:hypothetical protein
VKKYQVLESGKPCDCRNYEVHPSWNQSIYDTFDDAMQYAKEWFWPFLGQQDSTFILELNKPYDYDGCGSTAEIREIDDL